MQCHKLLYDMLKFEFFFLFDYWVVVLKIFTLFFTCKDFLIAHLLWISYHIIYLVSNTNNQVTELHDKRMTLNKYVCHTRQKKRCYRAEFKRRTMPSCTWMILGLVMHKGNNIPTLTAWNDDWNWPWSKISSQACHWKLLHNCVTDVKEHTRDECTLRIRISCSYNWCAVLMLPGIKQDELQGVLRHCTYIWTGSLIFILLSCNLMLELLLCLLSTGEKLFLVPDFKIFFWLIHFLVLQQQQKKCNRESVTCNKILPSPGSSYSAPANLPISMLKIPKYLLNFGP